MVGKSLVPYTSKVTMFMDVSTCRLGNPHRLAHAHSLRHLASTVEGICHQLARLEVIRVVALVIFSNQVRGKHVIIMCYTETVVMYINK